MNSRDILTTDLPVLQAAIDGDKFHPGEWKVEDFRGFSELYEDKAGIVVFCLYTPAPEDRLRIATMWVTPDDAHRNARAIVLLVNEAAKRASAAGFRELVFSSTAEKLSAFCCKILRFKAMGNNDFVLDIQESR